VILCRSEDRLQAMSISLLHLHIIADEVDEFQAGGLPSEFPDRWLRWFFQGMPKSSSKLMFLASFIRFFLMFTWRFRHFNSISTTKILPGVKIIDSYCGSFPKIPCAVSTSKSMDPRKISGLLMAWPTICLMIPLWCFSPSGADGA